MAVIVVAYGATIPAQHRAALHSHGQLHPYYHVAIFGGIAWLAVRAGHTRWLRLLLLLAVIAFGGATEFVEYWFRSAALEWDDIGLDAIGAVLGFGIDLWQRYLAADDVTGEYWLE